MKLSTDDVVQVIDQAHHWYPALLIVREVHQRWIVASGPDHLRLDAPGGGLAFVCLKREQVKRIGRAAVVRGRDGRP